MGKTRRQSNESEVPKKYRSKNADKKIKARERGSDRVTAKRICQIHQRGETDINAWRLLKNMEE